MQLGSFRDQRGSTVSRCCAIRMLTIRLVFNPRALCLAVGDLVIFFVRTVLVGPPQYLDFS
jgi:hypothetical protein